MVIINKILGRVINFFFTVAGLLLGLTFWPITKPSTWYDAFQAVTISLFFLLLVVVTYIEDMRYGRYFNDYLFENYNGLPIFYSIFSNKTHVRVKIIRGALYCGCILSHTYKFTQFAFQIRHIIQQKEFIQKVNWLDKTLATLLFLSGVFFVIGAFLPYIVKWF